MALGLAAGVGVLLGLMLSAAARLDQPRLFIPAGGSAAWGAPEGSVSDHRSGGLGDGCTSVSPSRLTGARLIGGVVLLMAGSRLLMAWLAADVALLVWLHQSWAWSWIHAALGVMGMNLLLSGSSCGSAA